jgi:hypothetical protein
VDALLTLRDARMRVELCAGGALIVSPRALASEWSGFIRENKAEIVALLQQEQAPVYPWPAILGAGPWTEIPAPEWAPEDLTGWRRWFEGPNGEIHSVT